MAQVKWHNSDGPLESCVTPCTACGGKCGRNRGVGEDPPVNGRTNIHLYNTSNAYVNQDLECQVSGKSAFIGVYLKNGGELVLYVTHACVPNSTTLNVMYVWNILVLQFWYSSQNFTVSSLYNKMTLKPPWLKCPVVY